MTRHFAGSLANHSDIAILGCALIPAALAAAEIAWTRRHGAGLIPTACFDVVSLLCVLLCAACARVFPGSFVAKVFVLVASIFLGFVALLSVGIVGFLLTGLPPQD
jgi:hypothetical protein